MSRRRVPRPNAAYTDLLLARSEWSMVCGLACIVVFAVCVVADVVANRDDTGSFQFVVIAAILGIFASGSNAVLWYRCRRCVLSTGWREGMATIKVEVDPGGRYRAVTVEVDHLDGTFTNLSVWSWSRLEEMRGRAAFRVLVGGRGTASALVIPPRREGEGKTFVSRAHGWASLSR